MTTTPRLWMLCFLPAEPRRTLEPDLAADAALINGFYRRERPAELAFATAVDSKVNDEVSENWPKQWRYIEDIRQDVHVTFLVERGGPKDDPPRQPFPPPLVVKVKQFVNTVVRRFRRAKKFFAVRDDETAQDAPQEASAHLRQLLDIATALPGEQPRILIAEMLHATGRAPPAHEVLGITEGAARLRLLRAQEAVLLATEGEAAHA